MSLSISHINKIVHFPCHVALWRWWRGAVVIWRKQEPLRSEINTHYNTHSRAKKSDSYHLYVGE